MAISKLIPARMDLMNTGYPTPTSMTVGADGMEIDYHGRDFRILLSVAGGTATITAGNGIQGVADLEIPTGQSVVLESGAFKHVTGTHKGTVFVSGAASATIVAIELP